MSPCLINGKCFVKGRQEMREISLYLLYNSRSRCTKCPITISDCNIYNNKIVCVSLQFAILCTLCAKYVIYTATDPSEETSRAFDRSLATRKANPWNGGTNGILAEAKKATRARTRRADSKFLPAGDRRHAASPAHE